MLARLAPQVRVVDLTHGVPRGDVLAGAVTLADCVPYLPTGVTLAVVDPGVGTARAAVAVRAGPQWFVGPDNGLLAPAIAACGGASSAWLLRVPDDLPATFHGRDVFAPVAARLATGADPATFARPLDPAALHPLALPTAEVGLGVLQAEVLLVDTFGNLSLAATAADLAAADLQRGDHVVADGLEAVVGRTFADVAPGRLLVHVDAAGRVALAVNGGSAAERLGAGRGTALTLERSDAEARDVR